MRKYVLLSICDSSEELFSTRLLTHSLVADKDGKYLMKKLPKESSFILDSAALFYCDSNFTIPIAPDMKPLEVFPQLILEKITGNIADNETVLLLPRLAFFPKLSPKNCNFSISFEHVSKKFQKIDIKFPIQVSKQSTLNSYVNSLMTDFKYENIIKKISKQLNVTPQRIKFMINVGEKELSFADSGKLCIQDLNIVNQKGQFCFNGSFNYEILNTISIENLLANNTIDESTGVFIDQVTSREKYLSKVSNDIKEKLMSFKQFLLDSFKNGNLTFFMPIVIDRVMKEYNFEENSQILNAGMKYILSETLVDLFGPHLSVLNGNIFLKVKTWTEMNHLFLSCNSNKIKEINNYSPKELISCFLVYSAASLTSFVEHIVDISYKICQYFRSNNNLVKYESGIFLAPIIFYSSIFIGNTKLVLVLTRGFIYIIDGKIKESKDFKDYGLLPCKLEFVSINSFNSLPLQDWLVILLPMETQMNFFVFKKNQSFIFSFNGSEQTLLFWISYHVCCNELTKKIIKPWKPNNCFIEVSCNNKCINTSVHLSDLKWDLSIYPAEFYHKMSIITGYINPTLESAQIRFQCENEIEIIGTKISSKNLLQYLNSEMTDKNKGISFEVSICLSMITDLIFATSYRAIFEGLKPFKISDFSFPIIINSPKLLQIQLEYFSIFINEFTIKNIPFIHYACLTCNNALLIRMIFEKYSLFDQVDNTPRNRTPIFYALQNPNITILQILIDMDADIEKCDSDGISPLVDCIQRKDKEKIIYLLNIGATVRLSLSDKYQSPIYYAASINDIETLNLLIPYINNYANWPSYQGLYLVHLFLKFNIPSAFYLIQKYVPTINPNLFSDAFEHPLHYIFTSHLTETMLKALLILPNLDLNVMDKNGDTPLIKAVKSGVLFYVNIIVKDPRCDIDMYNKDGLSPLYLAVKDGNIEIVKSLISAGALVNQPILTGETPISVAILMKKFEIIELLLNSGANVNFWYYKGKLESQLASENVAKLINKYSPNNISLSFDD